MSGRVTIDGRLYDAKRAPVVCESDGGSKLHKKVRTGEFFLSDPDGKITPVSFDQAESIAAAYGMDQNEFDRCFDMTQKRLLHVKVSAQTIKDIQDYAFEHRLKTSEALEAIVEKNKTNV